MALVIEDKATGFLKQLGIVAPNYINEALSKGAYIVYGNVKKIATSHGDGDFSQYHSNGNRGLISKGILAKKGLRRGQVLTGFGSSYRRVSRTSPNQSAQGASSMAELTRWRLYDGKMKAVVGWMNTKSFSPTSYENGEIKGKMSPVKGTSLYDAKKDPRKTQNIAELMEFGGVIHLTEAQKRLYMASGMSKAAARGNVIRKSRPVVAPAYAVSRSAAEAKMVEVVSKIVDYREKNNLQRGAA